MDEPLTSGAPQPAAKSSGVTETAANASKWNWALRLVAVTVVVALLALLAWATLKGATGANLPARVAAGERPQAPRFSLEVVWPRAETWPRAERRALVDGRIDISELRGRPLVINFWASWCIPCRDEAPILNASARAHEDDVVFLGVNVQDLREDALAFSREFATPYVSVRDKANDTYERYGLTGVPETYYVDARGRVVAHAPGPVTRDSLEGGIARSRGSATR